MVCLTLSALLPIVAEAADKNGVSANAISLPSGPGSVEGLGESFEPSLNNGTANHKLSFHLPPGTAGHAPALGIRYDGGQGNGPLGFGWTLPMPFVQRQTDKGVPRYVDSANGLDDDRDGQIDEADELDTFIDDSKEELVPLANGDYFCENEQSFIRYRRTADHWEGTLPNGVKLEFGLTQDSRVFDSATNHVFKWLLERQTDTHGNTILYTWQSFPGDANRHQKFLKEIRYGPAAPPWPQFHFVTFAYQERPDWFEDCRAGFVVRTGRRLTEITIGSQGVAPAGHASGDFNGDGQADVLNRKYRLAYLDYAPGQSHWSLLHEVTQIGADAVSALPPARFGYTVCHPPGTLSASGHLLGGANEPTFAMDNANVELVDLNGDALPDLLRTGAAGGAHIAYLNRGEQTNAIIAWEAAKPISSVDGLAWNVTLQSSIDIAHLADMNGDGLADLTYKSALGDVFFFANHGELKWGNRQPMTAQDNQPPAVFGNPNVRTADVDFDKRIDVIESLSSGNGADYRIWFNLGNQRYAKSLTVPQTAGFLFSLAGVHLADFNGDRVPDILRIQPTALTVTAGLGYGQFAPPITVSLPDWTLDSQQIGRARLEDITGDGLVDLILERAAPGQIWYWINKGNYTLDSRRTITGLPGGLAATTRWADLNGNGTTDLVFADSAATPKMLTLDLGRLLGCVPAPNTLTRIENGIGRSTTIEYSSSTRFALADAAAGQAWTNRLPFPVTVVSRVLTGDSLGHVYETRWQYHDGYYDAGEKEFRGFGRVEQIDVGDAQAPTLVTRSHFDTGRQLEAMKGRLLRLTAEQEDGQLFWDEMTSWVPAPRTLYTGTNGQTVKFVHVTHRVRVVKELGHGEERVLESEFAYDNYGNQTYDANYGVVVAGDRFALEDERVRTNQFALNLEAWIVRVPSRIEIRNGHEHVISRTESYYDDPTYSGQNLGSVQVGNLTLRREWSDPAQPNAYVDSLRARYDLYGNQILFLDPLAQLDHGTPRPDLGHYRQIEFDPAFHAYATRETIHIGQATPALVMEADYDAAFGRLVSARDFNGHETSYGYDVFGRLQHVVKPGDTLALPTLEYSYGLAVPAGIDRLVNYVETRTLDQAPAAPGTKRDHYHLSRQYLDGLSRLWMTKREATEPGSDGSQVAVAAATLFNARRSAAGVLNPFYALADGGTLEELLAFEDINAPGWQGKFHDHGQWVALNLTAAQKTATRYDAVQRPIEIQNPDGTHNRLEYEPLLTRIFDENDTDPESPHFDTPLVQHFDGLGRHIQTDELVGLTDDGHPAGQVNAWTTRYAYDLNDQLVRITDSKNNVKTFQYDGLRRLTALNDPDRGVLNLTYDHASNLIETRDAKNQRVTFEYDGVNRLVAEDYHDQDETFSAGHDFDPAQAIGVQNRPDVAYFYDAPQPGLDLGNGSTATAQNARGRLARVWDLAGEEHLSYDPRGRQAWTVKRVRDPIHAKLVSFQTQREYDSADRLVRLVYPDNDAVEYAYNERNLLQQIRGAVSGPLLEQLGYLPNDQLRQMVFGNGVITTCSYDARQRARAIQTQQPGTGLELLHFAYDFDAASNLQAIHDQRSANELPAGSARRNSQQFGYDDLYRLIEARYSTSLPGSTAGTEDEIHYRYDRLGNLLAQSSNIPHTQGDSFQTDLGLLTYGGAAGTTGRIGRNTAEPGPHALTAITPLSRTNATPQTFPYDANGNVTLLDGLTLTWDFKDRLVAAENASLRAEYTYDFRNRRTTKRVSRKPDASAPSNAAPSTVVLYPETYFEVRENDAPVKCVWNGGTRVARVTGSLSGLPRVQRLRLAAGWNLVALAVAPANLLSALQPATADSQGPIIEAAYRWDAEQSTFTAVSANGPASAGTVLWLRVASPGTLCVLGTFAEPTTIPGPIGPGFVSCPGLEPLALSAAIPPALAAWTYDEQAQGWLTHYPEPLAGLSTLPPQLAPGEALYLPVSSPLSLTIPDSTLRIRYYHQDHLGSSSVLTDGAGQLVEETAFYPFGQPRHRFQPRGTQESYQFTQKEQDEESGLHYFEARYLASHLARFLSPDALYANPSQMSADQFHGLLSDPQKLNLYSYTRNNPLKYTDPTGNDGLLSFIFGDDKPQVAQSMAGKLLDVVAETQKKILSDPNRQRTVLFGHGVYVPSIDLAMRPGGVLSDDGPFAGWTEIPKGTSITFYSKHTEPITERLGHAIAKGTVHELQATQTYMPGDLIPNYRLYPPTGVTVPQSQKNRVVLASQERALSEILKPNMGPVDWAACRAEDRFPNVPSIDDINAHIKVLKK